MDRRRSRMRLKTDIVVDNCAICRNHIMDLCTPFSLLACSTSGLTGCASPQALIVKQIRSLPPVKNVPPPGVFATYVRRHTRRGELLIMLHTPCSTRSTSIASLVGSRLGMYVHSTTVNGSCRSPFSLFHPAEPPLTTVRF